MLARDRQMREERQLLKDVADARRCDRQVDAERDVEERVLADDDAPGYRVG